MADISKCDGEKCELKESCYRYLAPDSKYWQSYISPEVRGKDCADYWEDEDANPPDGRG